MGSGQSRIDRITALQVASPTDDLAVRVVPNPKLGQVPRMTSYIVKQKIMQASIDYDVFDPNGTYFMHLSEAKKKIGVYDAWNNHQLTLRRKGGLKFLAYADDKCDKAAGEAATPLFQVRKSKKSGDWIMATADIPFKDLVKGVSGTHQDTDDQGVAPKAVCLAKILPIMDDYLHRDHHRAQHRPTPYPSGVTPLFVQIRTY